MWEKVHRQGERQETIRDAFPLRDSFYWQDPGLSLRNSGLIKQLRTFEKSIQDKFAELERDPVFNRELIMQEKAILEATQKQIRNLERKTLYAELGQN